MKYYIAEKEVQFSNPRGIQNPVFQAAVEATSTMPWSFRVLAETETREEAEEFAKEFLSSNPNKQQLFILQSTGLVCKSVSVETLWEGAEA